MQDRFNTIAGWTLFAGVVALGSTLFVGEVFGTHEVEICEDGIPTGEGYATAAICEAQAASGGEAEAEEPIAFYLASADATRGENVFKKCTSCHNANQGGGNGLGPNLYGIMGANIAHLGDFSYSAALAGHGGQWDWENMSQWLKKPSGFISGNKMTFAGLSDPQDRADVMLWLNEQGSGIPVPPPPAPGEEGVAEGEAEADAAATEGELQTAPDTGTADDLTEESVEGTGSEGGQIDGA